MITQTSFDFLPLEILSEILSLLYQPAISTKNDKLFLPDIANTRLVCKDWKNVSDHILKRKYGPYVLNNFSAARPVNFPLSNIAIQFLKQEILIFNETVSAAARGLFPGVPVVRQIVNLVERLINSDGADDGYLIPKLNALISENQAQLIKILGEGQVYSFSNIIKNIRPHPALGEFQAETFLERARIACEPISEADLRIKIENEIQELDAFRVCLENIKEDVKSVMLRFSYIDPVEMKNMINEVQNNNDNTIIQQMCTSLMEEVQIISGFNREGQKRFIHTLEILHLMIVNRIVHLAIFKESKEEFKKNELPLLSEYGVLQARQAAGMRHLAAPFVSPRSRTFCCNMIYYGALALVAFMVSILTLYNLHEGNWIAVSDWTRRFHILVIIFGSLAAAPPLITGILRLINMLQNLPNQRRLNAYNDMYTTIDKWLKERRRTLLSNPRVEIISEGPLDEVRIDIDGAGRAPNENTPLLG